MIVSSGEEGAGEEATYRDRQLVLQRWPLASSIGRTCLTFNFSDKEDDVHHDFAWTRTNFSRKINMVPNGEYIESDKVFSTFAKVKSPSSTNKWSLVFSHCPWHGPWMAAVPLPKVPSLSYLSFIHCCLKRTFVNPLFSSGKDCEDEEHVSILLEVVSRFPSFRSASL